MVNVNWSTIEVIHCFIQYVSCCLGGGGLGGGDGGGLRCGRETQTGDRGLSVNSCSKYIDKLNGRTMRYIEELCETLL